MRKPIVFLSHSKQDKDIIEKLANDLRKARINVWYDEWEIPPGESFRRKIFQEGIPQCDLFFIYLTPNSVGSVWVDRELDAAFIQETGQGIGNMAIFVDSDETRAVLSPDLRALHSPVLNDEEGVYHSALANIISRTWEATSYKFLAGQAKEFEFEKLKLEKTITELENRILRNEQEQTAVSKEGMLLLLERKEYTFNEKTINLKNVFIELGTLLATGTNQGHFDYRLGQMFGREDGLKYNDPFHGYELVGELIIKGLVKRDPSTDQMDEMYCLTESGVSLLNEATS
ncbi:toll/interleukin-1 receptor domain-containing protein [Bacillus cereus group sp. MYBK234-1]|uniref:toll/interleukin-1 receptor domain-containing protein n=1 Tax=unclassified Bacillus cereus group TaxID=2750818 RepID=UPI003F78E2DD